MRQPTDAVLTCRDCGEAFAFSEDERHDFAVLGRFHAPSRCAACRTERKSRQAESRTPVVGPRFRELQQVSSTVICSSCGASTVVPFAARPGRRVYCSACYQRRRLEEDV
jgi:CxxC-x17-CxxC domain-containing protein